MALEQFNMVTETYNWEAPPTPEELADNSKKTTYYNWVRAYVLVKDDAAPANAANPE
jgi:hypothetical protein